MAFPFHVNVLLLRLDGVRPTPNNKQPPLAMIPIKILIIFLW